MRANGNQVKKKTEMPAHYNGLSTSQMILLGAALVLCQATQRAAAQSFVWPVDNPTTTETYAARGDLNYNLQSARYQSGINMHSGADVVGPGSAYTVPVKAAADGWVEKKVNWGSSSHGLGNTVVLRHANGKYSLYGHLDSISGSLVVGQFVSRGTQIGIMGHSSSDYQRDSSFGIHVHFEIKDNPTLGNASDSGPYWGYTAGHPSLEGYNDPRFFVVGISVQTITPIALRNPPPGSLNIRGSPGTTYYGSTATPVIGNLSEGQEVVAKQRANVGGTDWYFVDLPSRNSPLDGSSPYPNNDINGGWISGGIAVVDSSATQLRIADGVAHRIRSGAGTGNSIIGLAYADQRFVVAGLPASGSGCSGLWYPIFVPATSAGDSSSPANWNLAPVTGWICADGLEIIPGGNPPPAPVANAATSITSSGFTANWSTASGATSYRLDVSTSGSFSSFVPGYQGLDVGNALSRTVGGLSGSGTYYYRVRAYNGGGTSGNSDTITVTLIASDTTPPTISAFSVNPGSITLGSAFTVSYTVSDSGGSGLKQVVLRRTSGDGTAYDSGWQDIQTKTVSGNGPVSGSFDADTPQEARTYWYGMAVFDNANNSEDERAAGLGPVQRTVAPPPSQSYTFVGSDFTMFSFPFTPVANGSSLFSDLLQPVASYFQIRYVFSYDSTIGQFVISPFSSETAVAKKGYFAFSSETTPALPIVGTPVSDSSITLNQGWNFIGVTKHVVPPQNPSVYHDAFVWANSTLNPVPLANGLDPGQAYFVFSFAANVQFIGPNAQVAAAELSSVSSLARATRGHTPKDGGVVGNDFTATITVQQPPLTSRQTPSAVTCVLGMKTGATDAFDDGIDAIALPAFPGTLNGVLDSFLATSLKAPAATKDWPLKVVSQSLEIGSTTPNLNPVQVSWQIPASGTVDPTAVFQLMDSSGTIVIVSDMRSTTTTSFTPSAASTEKDYIIRVSMPVSPQNGSLQVTIYPVEVVSAGAQWQVDAGPWQNSTATVSGLTVGQHTVHFSSINGWTPPTVQSVSIAANQTTPASGTYIQQAQYGSLQVTINPAAAVIAGAQWQVDGGAWHNSGDTVGGLSAGNHIVHFNAITGWTSPADETVTINSGATATASGTYTTPPNSGAAFTWAKQAVGSGWQRGLAAAVDGAGNTYVTGYFNSPATFGTITLTAPAYQNFFVAKYDTAGNVLWAKQAQATEDPINWQEGHGVAVDGSGNCYVLGWFTGTASFGTAQLTATAGEILLVKYDSLGTVLWARGCGGSGGGHAGGVAVDGSGNIFVTGDFKGTGTFGSVHLTSTGNEDVFLAKYDPNGNATWARSGGGANGDFGYCVAADSSGNSYISGNFSGPSPFSGTTLNGSGMFVVKYDASGNVVWARQNGGQSGDGIGVDSAGNCYVAGFFQGTASFGGTQLVSAGQRDVVLLKYDSAGNVVWARGGGGAGDDFVCAASVDGAGNCYIAGSFGRFSPGTATFGNIQLVNANKEQAFVAKYDSAGSIQWAIQSQGSGNAGATVYGIAADGAGNAAVTGDFYINETFGNTSLSGGENAFLARLAPSGSLQVTISPVDAVNAGAQWQVDGGPWHNSGDTVSGLSISSHTVHFNTVTGWTSPTDQSVVVGSASPATLIASYSPLPTQIIGLSGNLAFGNVTVGTTAQSILTIANTGNSMLTISGIIYPSGFSGNWSGTIAAGLSQQVTVTFAPTSVTSYGNTLTVNADQTSGNNTYAVSGTGVPATAVVALSPSTLNQVYDGLPRVVTAATTPPGLALVITYNGSPTPPTAAGTYPVTAIVNDPNYAGSANGTLLVQKANPTIAWNNPADITYGTALSASQLNATANVPGTFAYSPAAGIVLNAGNAQVLSVSFTPNDPANYQTATATVNLNVLKATPVITWSNPADITYGTALSASQLNAMANVPGTFAYSPPAGTALNAGNAQVLSVTFTPNDPANYQTATATVHLNVLKATPVITWNNPADIIYGTALGASQLNATANVPGSFAYSPAAGTVLGAGNAQVLSVIFTPTDSVNYQTAAVTVSINVLKAPLTVVANSRTKTYGETLIITGTEFTASGLVNGDTVTGVTLSSPGASASASVSGSPYTITAAGATGAGLGNYTITYQPGALAVSPALLGVTAADETRAYGATNPVFTATYSGFVNGEDTNALGGSPALTTTADTNSPAGSYPIEIAQGTLSNANYSFSFTNGTLTVTLYALTVTADSTNRLYGAANPPFSGTVSGVQNGDAITATFTTTASVTSGVGQYAITPALSDPGGKLTNYSVITNNGVLRVNPALLTITADDANKTYGQTLTFAGTEFVANGLANGETIGSVTLSSTGAPATAAVSGSPYSIVPSAATGGTFDPANYSISYQNGSLTVGLAPLTVSGLTANSKVYDGTTAATITGTPALSGVVGSDSVTVSGTATGAFADNGVGINKPVTVSALTLGGADAGNYTLNPVILSANITARELTVTGITAVNKVYDGTTAAMLNTSGAQLIGVLPTDAGNVMLVSTSATGTFADASLGTGKLVTISGLTLSGSAAGNYEVIRPTTTADIIPHTGPKITNPILVGQTFSVSVSTTVGVNYTLEYTTSLTGADWTPAQTQLGTGGTIALTDTAATIPARFYRVRVQ